MNECPTVEAYEAVCAALHKSKHAEEVLTQRLDSASQQLIEAHAINRTLSEERNNLLGVMVKSEQLTAQRDKLREENRHLLLAAATNANVALAAQSELRDLVKAIETLIQPLRSENILAAVQRMVNEVEGAAEQFNAMRRTAEEMANRLSTAQAAEARLRGAGELTLMFHSGEPWDAERSSKWMSLLHTLIGTEIQRTRIFDYGATTKNLCDAVRAALTTAPTAALPDGEELLDRLANAVSLWLAERARKGYMVRDEHELEVIRLSKEIAAASTGATP